MDAKKFAARFQGRKVGVMHDWKSKGDRLF
jgi:hypothetical protein